MKEMSSDEARRNFRQVLNEVEHDGEHVTIKRYSITAAVLVPVDFYRSARQALGFPDDHETSKEQR